VNQTTRAAPPGRSRWPTNFYHGIRECYTAPAPRVFAWWCGYAGCSGQWTDVRSAVCGWAYYHGFAEVLLPRQLGAMWRCDKNRLPRSARRRSMAVTRISSASASRRAYWIISALIQDPSWVS
jgi:hypothetical protein